MNKCCCFFKSHFKMVFCVVSCWCSTRTRAMDFMTTPHKRCNFTLQLDFGSFNRDCDYRKRLVEIVSRIFPLIMRYCVHDPIHRSSRHLLYIVVRNRQLLCFSHSTGRSTRNVIFGDIQVRMPWGAIKKTRGQNLS